MPNPVFEAVRTVLAIREYQDKDVPEEVIRRVAESAHLSASAGNRQPWHFVVVRDRATLKRLGSLMRTGPYVAGGAFAIVVAYERDTVLAVSDASRAAQSMILTAGATAWARTGRALADCRRSRPSLASQTVTTYWPSSRLVTGAPGREGTEEAQALGRGRFRRALRSTFG